MIAALPAVVVGLNFYVRPGLDSVLALVALAFMHPAWTVWMGRRSGRTWLPWILALAPALLLAPVFLSGVPLDPRYSDGRIDLVAYFTGRGIPLIGLTTMMLLGASVARMLLPARSRATGVLAVVGSGLIGALGPVLFIFPIVGFAARLPV